MSHLGRRIFLPSLGRHISPEKVREILEGSPLDIILDPGPVPGSIHDGSLQGRINFYYLRGNYCSPHLPDVLKDLARPPIVGLLLFKSIDLIIEVIQPLQALLVLASLQSCRLLPTKDTLGIHDTIRVMRFSDLTQVSGELF